MKLRVSLVVRPPSAPCHLRLSPTALLSDSCNHLAGNNASRAASRVGTINSTQKRRKYPSFPVLHISIDKIKKEAYSVHMYTLLRYLILQQYGVPL